jgi:hypothetical protein
LSLIKESEYVSKFLRKTGFAEYLIEINKSSITFEDHIEIMTHHFDRKDAFDPNVPLNIPDDDDYGNEVDHGDNFYQEAIHGRYDDFFVIPNEQYDRTKDDESLGGRFKQPSEYIINDMNKIIQNIDKELGHKWDKKRESFARHRLMCYLLEDRSKLENPKKK